MRGRVLTDEKEEVGHQSFETYKRVGHKEQKEYLGKVGAQREQRTSG